MFSNTTFIIYKEDVDRLNRVLAQLLASSSSTFVLLVHKDGSLLANQGFTRSFDTTTLAALAAGSYAATHAIARLIGESEFTVLFHKGKTDNIHITLVDEDTILVLVFDDRTNPGMVRLESDRAIQAIRQIMLDVRRNEPSELENSPLSRSDAVVQHIDQMFRDPA